MSSFAIEGLGSNQRQIKAINGKVLIVEQTDYATYGQIVNAIAPKDIEKTFDNDLIDVIIELAAEPISYQTLF